MDTNPNPKLVLDNNTYIEARFEGRKHTGYKKIFLGEDEPRRERLRNTTHPRIRIVESFIPPSFQNEYPEKVTAFYRDIEKRIKNGA